MSKTVKFFPASTSRWIFSTSQFKKSLLGRSSAGTEPRERKVVVCLVGVQTNQFPRAVDLGKQFRSSGIDVIMGGFHTSGTINMLGAEEPDIQELFRESITVVAGEVEGYWEGILKTPSMAS